MKFFKASLRIAFILLLTLISFAASSQKEKARLTFTLSMKEPSKHYFNVELKCENVKSDSVDFKMPAWTPGYYQLLDFAKNVTDFSAASSSGKKLNWNKVSSNTWRVFNPDKSDFVLNYGVKAERPFVATNYIDEERCYISPAGSFLHIAGMINHPSTIIVQPYAKWNRVATGLDSVAGKNYTYTAPDFDVLYDSPILIGNLEELPAFSIRGIPHRFIGHKLGEFDRVQFMSDLKKIIEAGIAIIGDIPYKHYTFLGIGPGQGGIEHLNSTSVSFNGTGLNTRESNIRMLNFLAHEYFHHYNVKRIRPIELGPFDYDKGSRTKMLWVSEGLSVYYEYMMVKRAGLMNEDELLDAFRKNIMAYENKPGRLFQSLTQASYETWSDGPFGRTGDEVNKTISYYDKGPAVGLLLDFAIRHNTKNKHSLDDVMKRLYYEYYKKRKRGFTEDEFKLVCEQIAGVSLPEIFDYVSTTKNLNYPKYFAYAGLSIDTSVKELPGAYLGITARQRRDSLIVSSVDWESPAWQAGIRQGNVLLEIDNSPATAQRLQALINEKKAGDNIPLTILSGDQKKTVSVASTNKKEKTFKISRMTGMSSLQSAILNDWLNQKGAISTR